ncbi:MAG: S1 family peptidase [Pleurocapsa minor GSE-CHR-MK-17-07R]|jgi:hypothetical protein|nr:S1 family peptidase [Pleurocapsa minor GSE-CHR-MK 17-07R]
MSEHQGFEAQRLHERELLAKRGVVGVGIGHKETNGVYSDDLAVVVLVDRKRPLAAIHDEDLIPRDLEGMRTDVIEVGDLKANLVNQPTKPPQQGRFRPVIPSGVSVGHYKVTAGTLGTLVKDKVTGELLVLSNNHVLANCNDAQVGDAVLQPAAMDGGISPADVVAKLTRYIQLGYIGDPLDSIKPVGTFPQPTPVTPEPEPTPGDPFTPPTNPTNPTQPTNPANPPPSTNAGCDPLSLLITIINNIAGMLGSQRRVAQASIQTAAAMSAVAQTGTLDTAVLMNFMAQNGTVPQNLVDCALAVPVDPAMFSDEILQIGMVNETMAVALNQRVRKYGRTTGLLEGNVRLLNATVNVGYATATGQRQAQFVGQVICDPISQGGDSGSLVVDAQQKKAVGLLFAGSPQATIFTPIDVVLDVLGITL